MKNYAKITLGVLLIVLGIAFLGNNYDWFNFNLSFREFAKWWPLLLVLAGVGVFLTPERRLSNPLSVLAIAFAIPLAIFSFADDKVQEFGENDNYRLRFEDDGDQNYDEEGRTKAKAEAGDSKDRTRQSYKLSNEIGIKRATLDFGGGAAEFFLGPTSDYIFEANTILSNGSYKLNSDRSGDEMDINFEMVEKKNRQLHINDDYDFDNDVYLKLNPKVIWNIKLGIGAGDLDFDLSEFKVEHIKVETGVAAVKLKFSDLLDEAKVDIKSGVAKIELSVPEEVGCRINLDGAMNSKTFRGFDKVGKGRWETPNFASAAKKVYIDLESGLSSINISRH